MAISACFTTLLCVACFDVPAVAPATVIRCSDRVDAAPCPAGLVCLVGGGNAAPGSCVPANALCIDVDDEQRRAVPQPDGNACAEDGTRLRICRAAVCIDATCGDGVKTVQLGETCDAGELNGTGTVRCRSDCTECGDGVPDTSQGEECDDGSNENSDTSPDACRSTCLRPSCGDGVIDVGLGETCEVVGAAASSDCRGDSCTSCGDGVIDVDGDEACDDGASNSDTAIDACRTSCKPASCGDGVTDSDELCDEGEENGDLGGERCRSACVPAACGDGVLDLNDDEECDDGEDNSDVLPDACRTSCRIAGCGDAAIDDGEGCDDGAGNSDVIGGACRTSCNLARCGDGVLDDGEECDEGDQNALESDACRPVTCALPACGDGIVDASELCDDGNITSGDGCRGDCAKNELCGDGFLDPQEQCDDANANPADGCDSCDAFDWTPASDALVSGNIEGRDAIGVTIFPTDVDVDRAGRILFSDFSCHCVRRLELDGTVTLVAGNGSAVTAGDGGRATDASLFGPSAVVADALGGVFIAELGGHIVRHVDDDGTITTVAGTGTPGFSGDGGPATEADLVGLQDLALDRQGRLYISASDIGHAHVRRVNSDGTIETVAGTTTRGFSGDGGPAVDAELDSARAIAVDALGQLLIADTGNARVRRVDVDGTIDTIAGNGIDDSAGDAGPALDAAIALSSIALDRSGRLLIVESAPGLESTGRVRRVDAGIIDTIALTPRGTARAAVDLDDTLIGTDTRQIFRIDAATSVIAGNGGFAGNVAPDGTALTSMRLSGAPLVAIGADDSVFIVDTGALRVRRVVPGADVIATVAGNGALGVAQDGANALETPLAFPGAVAVDSLGRLHFTTTADAKVWRLESDGTLRHVAGGGIGPFSDGDPATAASFTFVDGLASLHIDQQDRLLIADSLLSVVYRVDLDGTITTVVGLPYFPDGLPHFSGDGGAAVFAELSGVASVTTDGLDQIYVADADNGRVRRVDADGVIDTVAGGGIDIGDGIPAVDAAITPFAVAIDSNGDLLIGDLGTNRVRRVDSDRLISTVAGSGSSGSVGDGGPAIAAALRPNAIAVDPQGRILIVDERRVRRVDVDAQRTITTFVGEVHPLGPGFGARASLYNATAIAILGEDVLAIGQFGRILRARAVTTAPPDRSNRFLEVVVGYPDGSPQASDRAQFTPLLDARGIVLNDDGTRLFVVTPDTLELIELDPSADGVVDDAPQWTMTRVGLSRSLADPAGVAFDSSSQAVLAADEGDHCVVRVDPANGDVTAVDGAGECGARGVLGQLLDGPRHVARSNVTGALYISDTGNNRVVRVDVDGSFDVVIGDGSASSAGEGSPARVFPVDAPGQLALDAHGNLYVTSRTTVRLIARRDGDFDANGDGDVLTIFGKGERVAFPESASSCLEPLALTQEENLIVADACQNFLIKLERVPR